MNSALSRSLRLSPTPGWLVNACLGLGLSLSLVTRGPSASVPTFATDIAPLLYTHCASCHHPQGDGPFGLLQFEEVRRRSLQLAEVTESRFMPPWKAADHGPALQGKRHLTDSEIDLFQRWHAAGAPAGDLGQAPPPPVFSEGWKLGPPDLILEMSEAFPLPATGPDVFRNFVIPVPLTSTRFVRAVEFMPGTRRLIHHASIALDSTGASRRHDAADPGPGWASMELGDTLNPNGHIIGWTPGQVPYEVYPGTAWQLVPGTDVVVQLHLLPSGKPEKIAPRIGLYFTDTPPTRGTTTLQLRRQQIDIAPGDPAYLIEESIVLPVSAGVLRLFPHAHYLGKDMKIFAELPDGTRQPLLHIPDWDFNWQSDYCFEQPVRLPAQSRLVMHYRYDNSAANPRNPASPPQRVTWGWGSTNEMGGVVIQLLLDRVADWAPIQEAQSRYELPLFGEHPFTLMGLAQAIQSQNRPEEAAEIFARVLTLDPKSVPARLALAKIQLTQGDYEASAQTLLPVLDLAPTHQLARQNLAMIQTQLGKPSIATALLETGLARHGTSASYRLQLGRLHLEAGDLSGARENFSAPVSNDEPASITADLRQNLAVVCLELRDWPSAKIALHHALEIDPGHRDARLMATGFALVENDGPAALTHLTALLKLPPEQRPATEFILRSLPAPAGLVVLARAHHSLGETSTAHRLLQSAIRDATDAGRTSEAQALTALIAELTPR